MKLWNKHIALLFAFLGLAPVLSAQQILFKNYSAANGLCSNTVWSIAQDQQGFMWFATKNGLNRFDGYTFKSYQNNRRDSNSIGNNFIHVLCQLDARHFMVGTEGGIYEMDLETEKFKFLPQFHKDVIFDIKKDRKGFVWIGTKTEGVYKYDPRNGATVRYHGGADPAHRIAGNQVRSIAEDKTGRIWLALFNQGVDVIDIDRSSVQHITAGNRPDQISSTQVLTVYRDLANNIWIGTLSGGLNLWENGGTGFKKYQKGGAGSLNDDIIRSIYQPAPDKLYVGTEKGLNILDIPSQQFKAYVNKTNDPYAISDNAVYNIYPDRDGGVWLGTYFGGVNYFTGKNNPFELFYATDQPGSLSGNAVSGFLEDKPGFFWVATENAGLNYFDANRKTFRQYPFAPGQQPLSYHNIHALFKDNQGRIWIGTFSNGLNIYNPATGAVKTYQYNPNDTTSLSNNTIYSIYQDRRGEIWVGTVKGLNKYDSVHDRFIRVHEMELQYNCIYSVYEDEYNNIWIATYDNGLIGNNRVTGKWVKYSADGRPGSLSSNKLISLMDDHEGNLWLGTDGGGLNKFNIRQRQFQNYNEEQGLTSIVYGIVPDDHDGLWLSTNNGLIRFNPHTGDRKTFTRWDKLQSKQFNYKAYLRASDGRIYFGGIHGFNAFHPDSISGLSAKPHLVLTDFQLFNRDVVPGAEESPLKKLIGFENKIRLSHDQSVLSIEYAALNYQAPEKTEYAYMMEGFDNNWNFVGNQRKATYTNLPPGTYTFRVKASIDGDTWTELKQPLTLVMRPPFYRTTVAYIFYILLVAGAFLAWRKYTERRAREKNQEKLDRLKAQREQEFYNQKIEFFTTMAHEIRTPLSLIIAPLEKLLAEDDYKPEIRAQLETMDENSDRLLNLVNQLLDFRRIESDIYTIRPEKLELISFIHSIYSRFSAISYQKGIKFAMVTNSNKMDVDADPEALQKILNNLLINAFKFTRSKVEICVDEPVTEADGSTYFSISVEDDGIGIPANQIDQIFKAFFKVQSGDHQYTNVGGTGIGLALARSLAEKHEGKLVVSSTEGVKTKFTLLIPYKMVQSVNPEPEQTLVDGAEDQPLIMVVEDDRSLQDFTVRSLRAESYRVLKAGNGLEALQLLESNMVDLILSDLMMPEMDGISLCRKVKEDINYSHIPFILLTAKGNSEAEIAGIESGADAYISKPFKWKHVTVVIKNLLDSRVKLKSKFTQQPLADINALTTNTHDKKFIERIITIIEDRITDPQLSVEELSREMTMSRSSLHKKLKAMSGHVPNEFIRLIRLRNAARMLLEGEYNISEVGYLTGFNSPSYFTRCFVQQFNVTPSEFAEKNRNKQVTGLEDLTKS